MMKRKPHDEESQSPKGLQDAPPENAASLASSSFGGSSGSASNNPILLARLVLRKVLTMLTSDDQSDDGRDSYAHGIVSLVKDIFTGMVVGLVVISSIIFLDREFVHLHLVSHHLIPLF